MSWYKQGGIEQVIARKHGGHSGPARRLSREEEAADASEMHSIADGMKWAQESQQVEYKYEWIYLNPTVNGLTGAPLWDWTSSMKAASIAPVVQDWADQGVRCRVWDRARGHQGQPYADHRMAVFRNEMLSATHVGNLRIGQDRHMFSSVRHNLRTAGGRGSNQARRPRPNSWLHNER
ncbi:MAG: hypothetical protein R2911_43970 [Caldilineaceae bacterium]